MWNYKAYVKDSRYIVWYCYVCTEILYDIVLFAQKYCMALLCMHNYIVWYCYFYTNIIWCCYVCTGILDGVVMFAQIYCMVLWCLHRYIVWYCDICTDILYGIVMFAQMYGVVMLTQISRVSDQNWCISTIYHAWDTSLWPWTLDILCGIVVFSQIYMVLLCLCRKPLHPEYWWRSSALRAWNWPVSRGGRQVCCVLHWLSRNEGRAHSSSGRLVLYKTLYFSRYAHCLIDTSARTCRSLEPASRVPRLK